MYFFQISIYMESYFISLYHSFLTEIELHYIHGFPHLLTEIQTLLVFLTYPDLNFCAVHLPSFAVTASSFTFIWQPWNSLNYECIVSPIQGECTNMQTSVSSTFIFYLSVLLDPVLILWEEENYLKII